VVGAIERVQTTKTHTDRNKDLIVADITFVCRFALSYFVATHKAESQIVTAWLTTHDCCTHSRSVTSDSITWPNRDRASLVATQIGRLISRMRHNTVTSLCYLRSSPCVPSCMIPPSLEPFARPLACLAAPTAPSRITIHLWSLI
jgi:hypothetical protein